MDLLNEKQLIPLPSLHINDAKSKGMLLGKGQSPLEIIFFESLNRPNVPSVRSVWKERHGGRAAPVMLVIIHGNHATICGVSGDDPPVIPNIEVAEVERLCRAALDEPDRHAVLRFLRQALEAIDSPMPGINNEGLFSNHAIGSWLNERTDISDATAKSTAAMTKTRQELLTSLGYEISPLPTGPAVVLSSQSQKLALAILLEREETPESANQRFSYNSPVSYALTRADMENLPYVIIANGPSLRIYPTNPGVGVGRRARTETFFGLQMNLTNEETIPLLWYLFSADALGTNGTFEQLLNDSKDYSTSLGERLRERVYQDAIPQLSTALVEAQNLKTPTQQDLDSTYHMALTLLFRILFIAYGEDKELLPYKTNEPYRKRSLKQKAKELKRIRDEGIVFDSNSFDHWDDAVRLFDAVNEGSQELGVPAYNGGLFSKDPQLSRTGAILSGLRLSNSAFGPVLSSILLDLDNHQEEIGPVDFRSLGVREFGTIYEGLLESELSIAETDLIIDKNGVYTPANGIEPQVRSGEVYIHNKSGARKSSGSYFTKAFAVDHLLDHSLESALDEHTTRLGTLDEVEAGKAFFDFRVADIAMGSGHFLVAAVDRIERRLHQYLAERPLPIVTDELTRLRQSAVVALGSLADGIDIEDITLLRRQIARRCIYGVDLNPIAVELARVSLWIHTFVPGLPLSMLDHHLVEGNSLVGIGTLEEAQELVSKAAGGPLFNVFVENIVRTAAQNMAKVGDLADADAAEIRTAREALEEARLGIDPLKAMFDILAASRMDTGISGQVVEDISDWQNKPEEIRTSNLYRSAIEVMAGIEPFHFPIAFPDVFARSRMGFDVILGNPPWEEVTLEELKFWTRHFPGLKGISQGEREERIPKIRNERPDLVSVLEREIQETQILSKVLMTGPFPGMGTGDPDLYKAFCWRFWHLVNDGNGRVGVVLPRSVWNAKGSENFRIVVLQQGKVENLTFLLNKKQWVFEDIHPQYTIALTNLLRGTSKEGVIVAARGPFPTYVEFTEGLKEPPADFKATEVLSWTTTGAVPLLTSKGAAETSNLVRLFKAYPKIGTSEKSRWRFRPNMELSATTDKNLMTFGVEPTQGVWPVYTGGSFNLWIPDNGSKSYYACAQSEDLVAHLYEKRLKSARNRSSAFNELDDKWLKDKDTLPCLKPRIAFRDIARATDSRTLIPALIPPRVFVTNKAPFCLRIIGSEQDEGFLLGILSSLILDWYARRVVEISVNFFIFNDLPIPRPSREHPLYQRIVALAGRLASPDERFADWAKAVGVQCGPLEPDEKEDMIHELDAAVAHLYGISEPQLRHIFETFHVGWDYEDRLMNTLEHYRRLGSGS